MTTKRLFLIGLLSFIIPYDLSSALLYAQESTPEEKTFKASGNPIFRHKYTADPAALVYKDTLYIYAGHDECPPPHNYYCLNK